LQEEIWKPVANYEGLYEVSNLGRVKRIWKSQEKILKPTKESKGYFTVTLCKLGIKKTNHVAKLVTSTFIGIRPEGQEVRHLDSVKTNNRLDNLIYGTHTENQQDMAKAGHSPRGTKCTFCKLAERDVKLIRKYRKEGGKLKQIADHFDIKKCTVWSICKGKNWSWLE
jgi:hypothetical protein